jgi:hypothetical protein
METEATHIADKLLSMRKQCKKTSVALAKAEVQSSFISSCEPTAHSKGMSIALPSSLI